MKLSFEEAARATHAKVRYENHAPAHVEISTDTRTIQRGQTYLALRGERFNGHDYVEEALEKGAAALVVDTEAATPPEAAALVVADTKAAYMSLASAAREKFRGRVVAITGSTGKTTTKELLRQLLRTRYLKHVVASPANENNEIGVSKLLLGLEPEAQVVVVEMGARHYGDIAALVEIARPHVGVLTNVGEAHLEIMGSPERLADTKWSLFSGGAVAVLNASDGVALERAAKLEQPPRWFGLGDAKLPGLHPHERGVFIRDRHSFAVEDSGRAHTYHIDARLPGEYNLENLAAALGAALELGCGATALVDTVQHLDLPSGRYERITLDGGVRVIFDAYNASMSGMIATLDAFAQESGARRIAVLGSMAELGPDGGQMHVTVGQHAAQSQIDILLVGGDFVEQLVSGARAGGLDDHRIVRFENNLDAISWLKTHAAPQDVVLLKGSRKYKLEEILEGLRS